MSLSAKRPLDDTLTSSPSSSSIAAHNKHNIYMLGGGIIYCRSYICFAKQTRCAAGGGNLVSKILCFYSTEKKITLISETTIFIKVLLLLNLNMDGTLSPSTSTISLYLLSSIVSVWLLIILLKYFYCMKNNYFLSILRCKLWSTQY